MGMTESDGGEAMEIAFTAYRRLQSSKYASVDRQTYVSLLRTCGKLLGKRRSKRKKMPRKTKNDHQKSSMDDNNGDDDDYGDDLVERRKRKSEIIVSIFHSCCQD